MSSVKKTTNWSGFAPLKNGPATVSPLKVLSEAQSSDFLITGSWPAVCLSLPSPTNSSDESKLEAHYLKPQQSSRMPTASLAVVLVQLLAIRSISIAVSVRRRAAGQEPADRARYRAWVVASAVSPVKWRIHRVDGIQRIRISF